MKLENHSQEGTCFHEQPPCDYIKAEHAAHSQRTGWRCDSVVKTNVSSEEAVCSIKVDKNPSHLNIVCATHTEQTSWKNESVVKMSLCCQDDSFFNAN